MHHYELTVSKSRLINILKNCASPMILSAGHTLGFQSNQLNSFIPLVPPYLSQEQANAAYYLRVGDIPTESLKIALELSKQIKNSYLMVLLNDTTHISLKESHGLNQDRLSLLKWFSQKNGLPTSYTNLILDSGYDFKNLLKPIGGLSAYHKYLDCEPAFWTESGLRNRFSKTIGNEANKLYLNNILSISNDITTNRMIYNFKTSYGINSCKLSSEPDSITGGPDCIGEIIQLLCELFGIRNDTLNYIHKAVRNYALSQYRHINNNRGTFVIFYPRICNDSVIAGIDIYKEYLAEKNFDWVGVICDKRFSSEVSSNKICIVTHKEV